MTPVLRGLSGSPGLKSAPGKAILIQRNALRRLLAHWAVIQHIADLTHRIAELKSTSLSAGSMIPSAEFVKLLQETLESWQERKKMLAESSSAPGKIKIQQAVGAARVPYQGK
jgi:hypothetical protein